MSNNTKLGYKSVAQTGKLEFADIVTCSKTFKHDYKSNYEQKFLQFNKLRAFSSVNV